VLHCDDLLHGWIVSAGPRGAEGLGGYASWINCQTASIDAHTGVDCADEAICKPTKDGKAYEPWNEYAANSLKERCRNDMETRCGVCGSDLQVLAAETGAVFMTLGQYAAANVIEDTRAPEVIINSPATSGYEHHQMLGIDLDVMDDPSGVYSVEAKLDGEPVSDGDVIDLLTLTLGQHTLTIRAEDTAGNVAEAGAWHSTSSPPSIASTPLFRGFLKAARSGKRESQTACCGSWMKHSRMLRQALSLTRRTS
jgi:hypothetical protein